MGGAKRKSRTAKSVISSNLVEPLEALQKLIKEFNNHGVVIGGIAASLLGQPRLTGDLDAVILLSVNDIPKLIRVADQEGIKPRITNAMAFARKNRVLLLQHERSGINIDISIGVLPFEVEMIERSQMVSLGQIQLRLPMPEDLIIMKSIAHRPKDLDDIKAIAISHPDLDRKHIRDWVDQFGQLLDLTGLWSEIEKLL
jgi:predicted nucleotidyltransferase